MIFLIASITPVIIFLYLTYNKDNIKEPKILLSKCFFGGFLSVVLALIAEEILTYAGGIFNSPLLKSFYEGFIVAAAPEELSKFIILYWLIWKNINFDQYYDGIIYAVFVSMGFALVENIMYVSHGGLGIAFARAVLAVPGHGFFAVLMGYYLSLAKFSDGAKKRNFILKSIFFPILFHGFYDFTLLYLSKKSNDPLLCIMLIIFFTFIVIRLWRQGIKRIKMHVELDRVEPIPLIQNE